MSALDVLRAARERLATPERWCQGASARTVHGDACFSDRRDAASWSLDAAISLPLITPMEDFNAALAIVRTLTAPFATIIGWQDAPKRTHAEVLALLNKAIAIAETQEKERA